MKKSFFLSILILIVFIACSDKKEEKEISSVQTQEKSKAIENKKTIVTEVIVETKKEVNEIIEVKKEELAKVIEVKKEAVIDKMKNVTASINAKKLYAACSSCHGLKAEKAALSKSEVINTWSEEKIYLALMGYKDGSYGRMMKGLMQGQVKNLNKEEIRALSLYISTVNK